jgi:hypothetical protein
MGEMKNSGKVVVEKPEGRPLEDLLLGVKIMLVLEWILAKKSVKILTEFIWFRVVTSGGLL